MRLMLWLRSLLHRRGAAQLPSYLDAAPNRAPALRWLLPRVRRRNRYIYSWLDDPND